LDADARRIAAAIRRVLNEDWDPLGAGAPPDEYDEFVWPIYRLVCAQDAEGVVALLQQGGEDLLDCGAEDDRLEDIAAKLIALAPANDRALRP
jgi:hypothetical protein